MNENESYGGCIICGSILEVCPKCGHCPEHHVDGIVDTMVHASPEVMGAATTKWRQKGGKFAVLADMLSGMITPEEAERRFDAIAQDA